jgi:hypothetical protein
VNQDDINTATAFVDFLKRAVATGTVQSGGYTGGPSQAFLDTHLQSRGLSLADVNALVAKGEAAIAARDSAKLLALADSGRAVFGILKSLVL